ncbi:Nonribosomal peptide synthetase [Metarhizium acridum]|uniref:Nonribosomal peptide synthetase n=1 Tax=Metarhizium acridum TaxID=92637 RepID=UPI001C6C8BDF|nr:Nonribosomal peptide synthetase [Metarhizium acridum]
MGSSPQQATNGDMADGHAASADTNDIKQLQQWNGKGVARDDTLRVHDLIQAHFDGQPSAPSVCSWDGSLTYRDLDQLSSGLADELMARGVGCETFVPLYFQKSKWTAVAILAVVRAGAAFVLLDDSHPLPRLREICEEAHATIVLAACELRDKAQQLVDESPVILVGETQSQQWPRDNNESWRASPVTGTSALYAVFTSGSTGKPKGAVNEHASLCAAAQASGRALAMSCRTRAFQFASYAFDPTIMDFLRTWIYGGCVCIPSPAQAKNDIAAAMTQLGANLASLTPSVARLLDADALPALRALEFAGEPMLQSDLEKWADRVLLVNAYGTAECSVYSVICSPVRRDGHPHNIGFAAGCVAWIVDPADHHTLLPIGQAGELVLEGAGIGRGYLSNKELTAASFVLGPAWLHQFRGEESRHIRLYKTGDLAQYQPDGSLRCLGRKDTQAKVRGQRIELGEVEWHIGDLLHQRHQVVVDVVQVHRGVGTQAVLVAFVRLRDAVVDEESPATELFATPTDVFRLQMEKVEMELKGRVPAYMVPGAFVALNYVPLSISGKTDRRRLREETAARPWAGIEAYMLHQKSRHYSPKTDIERILQGSFAHILGVQAEELAPHDSFFRRGGDSISAMQLSAHCRRRGLSITTQEIFQYPTIAELNARILTQVDSQAPSTALPFPLSPVQHMLLQQKSFPSRESHSLQVPSRSLFLQLARPISLIELESAIQSVIHRQPSLSMRFTTGEDGQLMQTVTSLIRGSYQCSHIQTSAAAAVATLDPRPERLNLETGPLLLADLITTQSDDSQHLLLVAPQIVVDVPSWQIILNELSSCFTGGELSSSVATASFQSWCEAIRPHINGQLNGQSAEWTLSNFWGLVDPSSTKSSRTISTEFILDASRTALLLQRGEHALRAEPPEILLGVFLHAFRASFPGRDGLQIFIERDGRTAGASQVVGQFTTYTPIMLQPGQDGDVVDVVRRAKHAHRKARKEHSIHSGHVFPMEAIFHWKQEKEHQALSSGSEVGELFLQEVSSPVSGCESHQARKPALFELNLLQSGSSLAFSLVYRENMMHQDAISQWFQRSQDTLDELLPRLENLTFRPMLDDFSQLSITPAELETLILDILAQQDILSLSDIADIYPASFIQQGMLLSQARDPQAYWSRTSWEARSRDGSVVVLHRLQEAWQQVAMSHSILRTLFVQSQDGSHYQVLLMHPPLPVKILPLNALEQIQVTTNEAPGGLKRRTLLPWSLTLRPLSDGSVTCEIQISHALMDGESMQLLIRDVQRAYDAEQPHRAPPLYSQYVGYLNQVSRNPVLEYWKGYLEGTEPCHFPAFPSSQLTPAVEKLVDLDIVIEDAHQLFSFCREEGITLFNVVQLAWAIVLQCYTGNETVAFGYLTSGRDVPIDGAEDMVGPLINMLIVRIDLQGDLSVRKHLHECRDRYMQSIPNQHCSLAAIYRALGHSGTPMFNTIITYQKLLPIDTSATIEFIEILDQQPTEVSCINNSTETRADRITLVRHSLECQGWPQ